MHRWKVQILIDYVLKEGMVGRSDLFIFNQLKQTCVMQTIKKYNFPQWAFGICCFGTTLTLT